MCVCVRVCVKKGRVGGWLRHHDDPVTMKNKKKIINNKTTTVAATLAADSQMLFRKICLFHHRFRYLRKSSPMYNASRKIYVYVGLYRSGRKKMFVCLLFDMLLLI